MSFPVPFEDLLFCTWARTALAIAGALLSLLRFSLMHLFHIAILFMKSALIPQVHSPCLTHSFCHKDNA
jgi:hypothetical protein